MIIIIIITNTYTKISTLVDHCALITSRSSRSLSIRNASCLNILLCFGEDLQDLRNALGIALGPLHVDDSRLDGLAHAQRTLGQRLLLQHHKRTELGTGRDRESKRKKVGVCKVRRIGMALRLGDKPVPVLAPWSFGRPVA